MKRILLIGIFLLSLIIPAISQPLTTYDNNNNIEKAHQDIYALKIKSAENLLQAEDRVNPMNAYITFYRLYSQVVDLIISNSPSKYKKISPKLEEYIKKLEKMPSNAPDYKMLLGESKVYSGMLKVKFGSKLSGMFECLKGIKLLESNKKEFPGFEPNGKLLGMVHVSVAFMPKALQWGIKILGIKGDAVEGLKELSDYSKFAEGKQGLEEEAFLLTMGAYKVMGQDEMTMKLIKNKMKGFKDIAVLNYLAATICLESNEGETAFELLSNIIPGKLETPFPYFSYLMGKAKLFRLDDDAHIPMNNFLDTADGPDFQKATLYNLACFASANGKKDDYLNYIKLVRQKGRELFNRDIEAAYEAASTILPNIYLMRAGLLIRGGYLQKAEPELLKVRKMTGLTIEEQVRYYFLSGEYNRLINNQDEAEVNYLKAINMGNEKGFDNAQEAIVRVGLMKEKSGLNRDAEEYFKLCLQFKDNNSPYSDLFNNKAKAGLIRLSQPAESHRLVPTGVLQQK
jgi:hypothetical protein